MEFGQDMINQQVPYQGEQFPDFLLRANPQNNLQNTEEFDHGSSSENIEGVSFENPKGGRKGKKNRYNRHNQSQVQTLEAFFEHTPHPDDKQRKELSKMVGLGPLQVKFWFQNKRTQTKNQQERQRNAQLRAENERLRAENITMVAALKSASCPTCKASPSLAEVTSERQQLLRENLQLRNEINRLTELAAKYVGKSPCVPHYHTHTDGASLNAAVDNSGRFGVQEPEMLGVEDLPMGSPPDEKPMIVGLAMTGMEELMVMAQIGGPMWVPTFNGLIETLNEEEYVRAFPNNINPRPLWFNTEATRGTALLIIGLPNLVEILMDANRWSAVFSGIVSKATTLEVFSAGAAGNYNGALQVMSAEYHILSPLVPSRESLFVRYCKQHSEKIWAVADVSLDYLHPETTAMRCRRRASGCVIEEMDNGLTKVTWVEHVEAEDRGIHDMYKPLVNSGLAFGAKRWLSTLDRQCERLTSIMSNNNCLGKHHDIGIAVVTSQDGWKRILKLAEKMVKTFCDGVTSSACNWSVLTEASDNIRVTIRKPLDEPCRLDGVVLNAATSFWLPIPMKKLFEFLRHQTSRNEWDILSREGELYEMAHISIGQDEGNCLSLFRPREADTSSASNMLVLQENCSDMTGAYIVHAPADLMRMKMVLNGGSPDFVTFLASGFAIFPDGPSGMQLDVNGDCTGGSLLTVSFQILIESSSNKLSLECVGTISNLINDTVERINTALGV